VSKYLRIGVSAVLLAFIGWKTDWTKVSDHFARLNGVYWLGAVVLLVLAQVISAKRWQLFAHAMRFERTLGQYTAYYFIGSYFNLLLPTSVGGDVMRVWYLNADSGRKMAALASVFLERVNGLLVLIALACFGALCSPVTLQWWIHALVWGIAGCAVLGIAASPFTRHVKWLPQQRREQLQTMHSLMYMPRLVANATGLSILVQGLGVVSVWCVGMSLGLEVPIAYYCILGPMVSLLTLLPISVNGMGVREFGTFLFLAQLGVDESTSNTLAFLWFAVSVTVSLLGGAVYLIGAYPRANTDANTDNEGTNAHGPVDRDSDQGREGQLAKAA
jgi:uncharacterized membrane protein YbhN (UPF0104 family)